MSAVDMIAAGLRRVGLAVSRFPAPHSLSRCVKEFLRDNGINLVLDVGAFHGTYCALLREEAGYTGAIRSFEPCSESYQVLCSMLARDPLWRGYQFGLSDHDSTAVLNTHPGRGNFNSLLRLREEGGRAYCVDTAKASTEPIQLNSIDTIWDEITQDISAPRVFLKIDTQGHDMAVALGAAAHLPNIIGIQTEMPVVEIYDGMTPMTDALSQYQRLGYVPIGFYPVNTPRYYGVSPEFDVILRQFR